MDPSIAKKIHDEFEKVRTNFYMHPGDVDLPQVHAVVEDTAMLRFRKMIDAAQVPEVEIEQTQKKKPRVPLVPLKVQAKPLLEQLTPAVAPSHTKKIHSWTIRESKSTAEELIAAALRTIKPTVEDATELESDLNADMLNLNKDLVPSQQLSEDVVKQSRDRRKWWKKIL